MLSVCAWKNKIQNINKWVMLHVLSVIEKKGNVLKKIEKKTRKM